MTDPSTLRGDPLLDRMRRDAATLSVMATTVAAVPDRVAHYPDSVEVFGKKAVSVAADVQTLLDRLEKAEAERDRLRDEGGRLVAEVYGLQDGSQNRDQQAQIAALTASLAQAEADNQRLMNELANLDTPEAARADRQIVALGGERDRLREALENIADMTEGFAAYEIVEAAVAALRGEHKEDGDGKS